jgi:membrane protein implicated in regulation of membrane protease activity
VKTRRWDIPEQPPPRRPYRDTLIFHLFLACMLVLVAWLTGGGIWKAVGFAIAFFVIATAWSWSRWRKRLTEERRAEEQRVSAASRPARRESR